MTNPNLIHPALPRRSLPTSNPNELLAPTKSTQVHIPEGQRHVPARPHERTQHNMRTSTCTKQKACVDVNPCATHIAGDAMMQCGKLCWESCNAQAATRRWRSQPPPPHLCERKRGNVRKLTLNTKYESSKLKQALQQMQCERPQPGEGTRGTHVQARQRQTMSIRTHTHG